MSQHSEREFGNRESDRERNTVTAQQSSLSSQHLLSPAALRVVVVVILHQ
jgi:hypothetical protein